MAPQTQTVVELYTDGACSPNPGVGGWGVVLIAPGHERFRKELAGAEAETTNNRMELLATIQGLQALKRPCLVKLYTDSQYVQHAFTQGWLAKWQKNRWLTSEKKPVANQDLWQQLVQLAQKHVIEWHWVRGHAGHPENERCDELAVQAREALALKLQTSKNSSLD